MGLLHGIPISLKDQFYMKGTASNLCHSHNLYPTIEEDGTLVRVLKEAGAILFVKSTTPVSVAIETKSYLWEWRRDLSLQREVQVAAPEVKEVLWQPGVQ